jgi:adenine phosphoribosyltransferase
MKRIKNKIREIPNFPKQGVSFKDITPLLEDKNVFGMAIYTMALPYMNSKIDKVVGIDARGFLFSAPVAYALNAGVAIVRKKGKLPSKVVSQEYDLEYGTNTIEMHKDSILPNERILLVDDVLATGGTMEATIKLVEKLKGKIVGIVFLLELTSLKGREKLKEYKIKSLIKYDK